MFNQLIESEPEGADFKNRRGYFMVSSFVVGVLFLTAVVISIYAADIGLGNSSFELVEMVSPPDLAPSEPETAKPQPNTASKSDSTTPSRVVDMATVDDPTRVPLTTSTEKNTSLARPNGRFLISDHDANTGDPDGVKRDPVSPNTGGGISKPIETVDPPKDTEPPDVKPPAVPRMKSGGVVNGMAKSLPKPVYSAAAAALQLSGKVDVQVIISESGKVISAKAISGHPILRPLAESAAWRATFGPTLLTDVPVKVTGVIVYNFTR